MRCLEFALSFTLAAATLALSGCGGGTCSGCACGTGQSCDGGADATSGPDGAVVASYTFHGVETRLDTSQRDCSTIMNETITSGEARCSLTPDPMNPGQLQLQLHFVISDGTIDMLGNVERGDGGGATLVPYSRTAQMPSLYLTTFCLTGDPYNTSSCTTWSYSMGDPFNGATTVPIHLEAVCNNHAGSLTPVSGETTALLDVSACAVSM